MSNEAPNAPAGWYPSPDGRQRYWDGESWLNIPQPEKAEASTVGEATAESDPLGAPHGRRRRTWIWVTAGVAAAVIIVGGGIGIAVKSAHDEQVAVAAAVAKKQADEAQRKADAEAAQQAADDQERTQRAAMVPEIEASVKKMAIGHAKDDLIDGPVKDVTCSPVGGGSTDDLTEQTTVFDCFVATKDNGDGTMSGYDYNATMNWSTSEYTYGIGKP